MLIYLNRRCIIIIIWQNKLWLNTMFCILYWFTTKLFTLITGNIDLGFFSHKVYQNSGIYYFWRVKHLSEVIKKWHDHIVAFESVQSVNFPTFKYHFVSFPCQTEWLYRGYNVYKFYFHYEDSLYREVIKIQMRPY